MEMAYVQGQIDAIEDSMYVTRDISETGDTTYAVEYDSSFYAILPVHYDPNISQEKNILMMKGMIK